MIAVRKVAQLIASSHPNLDTVGSLILKKPVGNALLGLYLDSSKLNPDKFYISWVVIPLCSPTEMVYFCDFGNLNLGIACRLTSPDGAVWNLHSQQNIELLIQLIEEKIFPVWNELSTFDGLIDFLESTTSYRNHLRLNILERLICLEFMHGNLQRCSQNVDKFWQTIEDCSNPIELLSYSNPYYKAMQDRVHTIQECLKIGDYTKINDLIEKSSRYSIDHLKIGSFVR